MPRRSRRNVKSDSDLAKNEELWNTAEEIFNKSPNIVQKEILKYINVNLVKTELRKKNGLLLPKIGNQMIRFAKNGHLKPLKNLLNANNFMPEILNYSTSWEEVEEKWGYDKSWTWNSDTPLLVAIRSGHIDIVKFLLMSGADPTLQSCVTCDVYDDALTLAKARGNPKMISLVELAIPFWDKSLDHDAGSVPRNFLTPNRPKSFIHLREALENC